MSKLLLYCTKAKPDLVDERALRKANLYSYYFDKDFDIFNTNERGSCGYTLNGKIVAECDYEVEEIEYKHIKERDEFGILHNEAWQEYRGLNITDSDCDLTSKSCLTADEIFDYLLNKNGYAIHIKNLNIFDKPKELSEYYSDIQRIVERPAPTIKKAPQNMMYAFDKKMFPYVLISIRPEWLCKILNGEKTIEIRKKVLKGMLE